MGPSNGPAADASRASRPAATRQATALRYALAAAAVLLAFAVKLALPQYFGPPFILFYPAVAAAALLGDLGPSLLATGLASLLSAAVILPAEAPGGLGPRQSVGLLVFTVTSALLGVAASRLRATRADEALRRYQLLANHSRDIILFVRRHDGRILEANAAACAAYGYTDAELRALHIQALRPEEDAGLLARQVAEADRSGGIHFEAVHRRKDGSTFPVEVSTQAATVDGTRMFLSVVRDITQRRRDEEALRASEERLRLFVDHAPAAVAMLDREMRYLAVSRRFVSDYRLPARDLLGRSHYEVFPEIPERWREIHRRCLAGAVERCEEDPFPRADGAVDWVRWEIRPWRDSSGRIGGVVLFSEDITRRKRDELARRESEARYRVIFDQAAVGVALVESATNRILEVNARYCEILGYPREALVGRTWADITHPDELETDRARVRHMLATGEPYRREKRYLHSDGSVVWASLTVSPVALPGSHTTTQVAMVEDVTERHRAAEALRQSAERFRALFEKVAVGMAEMDARTGAYVRVNDAFCTIVGYPREELLRMGWPDITHPDDLQADREAVGRLVERHGSYAREKRYLRRDGAVVWVQLTTSPVWPVGSEPTTLASVVQDVTGERRLEEQLRQAQKLESIGRLAGGVAHDFNNLLTVILSCSGSLAADVAAGRSADPVEIAEIQAAGTRASELTRQLLAFARKQAVSPVALDLGAVVHASERLLRRVLGEDVELTVTAPSSPWLVRCDPGQVEQVILNLAVNARDAMPDGGRLAIAVDHVEAAAGGEPLPAGAAPGAWVRLSVRDTGVGMTEEVRAHLFEPFFTTKPVGQGTGLGLATVYGIVAQSGGHLRVESAPGRGSTLEVWLPRTEETPAAAAATSPAAPGGSEPVLVVEDDPAVRHVIGRLLSAAGYQVRLAGGPQDALALPDAELVRFQLLVTDVVMPGLDGPRLAEALRRRHPGLRVLFVSGHAGDALAQHGGIGEGEALLAKPFTGRALLQQTRQILDG